MELFFIIKGVACNMKKICFVCLGNICRSPAAEAIFEKMAKEHDLDVRVDSAGTSAYHKGEPADQRMIRFGKERGYDLKSLSRQFIAEDGDRFDLIVTMDNSNHSIVRQLIDRQNNFKLKKMSQFFSEAYDFEEVPDPYFGGEEGFQLVYDLLANGCQGIIDYLKNGEMNGK